MALSLVGLTPDQRNMRLALAAVRNTNAVLSLGPENSVSAAVWSVIHDSLTGGLTDKEKAVKEMREGFQKAFPLKVNLFTIPRIAAEAGAIKTGRCGEFAAVTFVYLMQQWVQTKSNEPLFEFEMVVCPTHWIVIVGRAASTDLTKPPTWNQDAVVADAWNDECYFGKDFKTHQSNAPKFSVRFPGASDDTNKIGLSAWDGW